MSVPEPTEAVKLRKG